MRTVFVNPERCIGCRQCEYACAVEHSQTRDPIGALFETPPPRTRVHVEPGMTPQTSFPNRCVHCDPAPCQQICPTGSMHWDRDEGLVLVDADRCIACAMCAIACPFSAITFHSVAGNGAAHRLVAVKCDGCIDRVRRDEEPACVEACKTDALVYGELNDLLAEERIGTAARTLDAVTAGEADSWGEDYKVTAWRSFGAQIEEIGSR